MFCCVRSAEKGRKVEWEGDWREVQDDESGRVRK